MPKLLFSGLGEHQFWCGDDLEHPADWAIVSGLEVRATQAFDEMRLYRGDVCDYARLGNAQAAIDQGMAVLVEEPTPPAPQVSTGGEVKKSNKAPAAGGD